LKKIQQTIEAPPAEVVQQRELRRSKSPSPPKAAPVVVAAPVAAAPVAVKAPAPVAAAPSVVAEAQVASDPPAKKKEGK
jgi:hypothetical protein